MRFRRFFLKSWMLFAFIGLSFGSALQPSAAADSVYTIKGVPVDATADSVTEAKARALNGGYEKAFTLLVERLVPAGEQGKVPKLGARDLLNYVLDISLANERSSSVRYIADMTVRFKPTAMRTYLRNAGVALAETTSKPVVVVPVLKQGGSSQLWEEGNPWRKAWMAMEGTTGLVPLVNPQGDLSDISTITAAGALAGKDGLWALAEKYGANDVFLTVAELNDAGTAATINAVRAGRVGSVQKYDLSIKRAEGEDLAAMLGRAAATLERAVQQDWKQANLLEFGTERWITVQVPISGLQDWVLVRNRLKNLPAVNRVAIRSMKRDRVDLDIYFVGSERQLSTALAQKDLALALNEQSFWEMRLLNRPKAPETLNLPPEQEDQDLETLSDDTPSPMAPNVGLEVSEPGDGTGENP